MSDFNVTPPDEPGLPPGAEPSEAPIAGEQPTNPAAVADVASISEENARLRAELLAENEKLRAALAESRASGLSFAGLTDEDVRKLEHPDEFVISNDELHSRLAAIESQLAGADKAHA